MGDSDDEFVFLKLECTSWIDEEEVFQEEEVCVSTTDITTWDLPLILSYQIIKIKANRNRLVQQSSYFRGLLGGSFSESRGNLVSIQWNPEIVISILQFICGCPLIITFSNFLSVLEGALFFGVETLLFECETWFRRSISLKGPLSLQISLDTLIEIWNFGLQHAIDYISELCTSYIARNFMQVISESSFHSVPYNFLVSCLEHPHLTVESEKKLCEALLVWLGGNSESPERIFEDVYSDILKKVRVYLLPLGFAAGKRQNQYLSKFADETISFIFDLLKDPLQSFRRAVTEHGFNNIRIRLTEFSERLDLSGSPQITAAFLAFSVLTSSFSNDAILKMRLKQPFVDFDPFNGDNYSHPHKSLSIVSFEAVHEVDVSKCPRLNFDVAIQCLEKAFPSLRILKASHCLQFKTSTLCYLVQKCPLIKEVDLTVDVSPVLPSRVSVLSCKAEDYSVLDSFPHRMSKETSILSNISTLTLEGRTDINDFDLLCISELSGSLAHLNIEGCTAATDVGISKLISKCVNLCSLLVSDTNFGRNSMLALCSDFSFPSGFLVENHESKYSSTLAFRLQRLHMGGCKSIELASLSQLVKCACSLKSLNLRETLLGDDSLYDFMGCSLEALDVSDTRVSGASLIYIVRRNPALKFLKARGCRNLHCLERSKISPDVLPYCGGFDGEELYLELSRTCILEEVECGWGFSPFALQKLEPAIRKLRSITVGLGAPFGPHALAMLPEICPFLETVVLNFQVITDDIVKRITESLRHLQVFALCCCFTDLTSVSFQTSMPNLRTLRLERVTPWMTNDDLVILSRNCSHLLELSLSGCTLLDSDSQQIISSGWPALTSLHLEDCGKVTSCGVSSLLDCKGIEDLSMRHNGRGIPRNFIADATSKLPMLRKVALDLCDANDGGFDSPSIADRFFLSTIKISCCKSVRNVFETGISDLRHRAVHKETIVLDWNSRELRTSIVKERV